MGHKTSPRRTGEMKKQVVRLPYRMELKAPKGKGKFKELVCVHYRTDKEKK